MRRDYTLRQSAFAILLCFLIPALISSRAVAQADVLPSWNDGSSRNAIIAFVSAVTSPSSLDFVPEAERVATFDMDGTLWVEQPIYPEVAFAYDQLAERAKDDATLAQTEPLRSILQRGRAALPGLSAQDTGAILNFAMSGMTVDAFNFRVQDWLMTTRQPCWNAPPTRLFYQPMLELLAYLEAYGFRNYVVTGSSQDFVRNIADDVLRMPPQQIVGTPRLTRLQFDGNGTPRLLTAPDVMLTVSGAGKPEAIHLFIGQRPIAAFGNSGGDADMLDYATTGKGRSLGMLVLHDDAAREYAYGPALGLPDTGVGEFDQKLFDRARGAGWHVISMRNDWRQVLNGVEKQTGTASSTACALP